LNSVQLLQEIDSLRPQRAASPLITFAVQSHAKGPVKIDITYAQICHFLDASPAVVKNHEECPITKSVCAVLGQCLEESIYLLALQKDRFGRLTPFGRNGLHSLSFSQHFWMVNCEVSVERVEGGKPLVSRSDMVSPLSLDHAQELQDSFRRKVG